MDQLFYDACAKGDLKYIKEQSLINSGGLIDYGLYHASLNGHKNVCDYLIAERGANNFNHALCGALYGNQPKLVDFFIEKGANDFNCLWYACSSGNEKLVKLILDKGGKDYLIGLNGACKHGHLNIAKKMIDYETVAQNKFDCRNIKQGFWNACQKNHLEIMIYLYKIGCNECHCQKPIIDHFPAAEKK